jgi:hypothetical protein
MKNTRNQMDSKHKTYIKRYFMSAWNCNLDYQSVTKKVNTKFNTNYSVYQIAGFLGRQIQLNFGK